MIAPRSDSCSPSESLVRCWRSLLPVYCEPTTANRLVGLSQANRKEATSAPNFRQFSFFCKKTYKYAKEICVCKKDLDKRVNIKRRNCIRAKAAAIKFSATYYRDGPGQKLNAKDVYPRVSANFWLCKLFTSAAKGLRSVPSQVHHLRRKLSTLIFRENRAERDGVTLWIFFQSFSFFFLYRVLHLKFGNETLLTKRPISILGEKIFYHFSLSFSLFLFIRERKKKQK